MQTKESDLLYRRLQQHLDRMPVGFPAAPSGVEIRILRRLFTPEEAEIALELSAIPEPAAVIHRRFGSADRAGGAALASWRRWGTRAASWRSPRAARCGSARWPFAIGMYERQLKTLTREFELESRQYFDEAFGSAFHTGKTTQLRIVPVNKEVAAERAGHDLRPHTRAHRSFAGSVRDAAVHLPPRARSAGASRAGRPSCGTTA